MTDSIEHKGIVESIDGDHHLTVKIIQVSACSTCSVKGHCTSADSKEKLISVTDYHATDYKKGDHVTIVGTTSMGMQAVLLAFVLPFLLIFFTLFIAMHFTDNEGLSAILGLLILIPYYIGLSWKKDAIKKKFSFTIKHINN